MDNPGPIEIPFSALSEDAQIGVIDDFIWREGTDYGAQEVSHDSKRAQIRQQIDHRKVRLVYDAALDSVTLITEHDWRRIKPAEAAPD